MKTLQILSLTASLTFASFLALLAFGSISAPAFFAATFAWLALVAVKAYTPRRILKLPRQTRTRVPASLASALPLAA